MYTDFFFPSHVVASNAWSLSFKGEALHTTFYDVYRIPLFFSFSFSPLISLQAKHGVYRYKGRALQHFTTEITLIFYILCFCMYMFSFVPAPSSLPTFLFSFLFFFPLSYPDIIIIIFFFLLLSFSFSFFFFSPFFVSYISPISLSLSLYIYILFISPSSFSYLLSLLPYSIGREREMK